MVSKDLCSTRSPSASRLDAQNTDLLALLSFDLDLPIACDDEYWETGDPATAFKQPPGHPSKIEFFNHYLKLMEIYTATFSAVVRPVRPLFGVLPKSI